MKKLLQAYKNGTTIILDQRTSGNSIYRYPDDFCWDRIDFSRPQRVAYPFDEWCQRDSRGRFDRSHHRDG